MKSKILLSVSSLSLNGDIVNSAYKNKVSGRYVYDGNKYLHSVGDKRHYFNVVLNNQLSTIVVKLADGEFKRPSDKLPITLINGERDNLISHSKNARVMTIVISFILFIVSQTGIFYLFQRDNVGYNSYKRRRF